MNTAAWLIVLGAALGGMGVWLALPGHPMRARMLGLVLGLAGLGVLGAQVGSLGHWLRDVVFWVLAGVTLVAAGATISFRSPVYCAIWFALSLLGTAGLFLFQGAQFLAVATIVVYAGAIVVTFLFVLMLAQPKGQAPYDRVSWEGLLSAAAGAVLVGILTMAMTSLLEPLEREPVAALTPPATAELEDEILHERHVARLGGELFSRYLIAVEVAGTLLLVALVGAIAIAAQSKLAQVRAEGDVGAVKVGAGAKTAP